MDYSKMTTEELRQIEQAAKEAVAKGGSEALQRARYRVLGAVSAELAKR